MNKLLHFSIHLAHFHASCCFICGAAVLLVFGASCWLQQAGSTIAATSPLAQSLPVMQNFNGMGTAMTATLPTDFRADKQTVARTIGTFATAATATEQRGGDSLSTGAANGIYNFGAGPAATATDRALGFLSSGSATKSGNLYAQLVNNTGVALNGLRISYDVEKYRNGTNAAGYRIQMYYSTDGATWTSAGSNFLTSFAADANNNGFATAPGTTVAVSNQTLLQAIANGAHFYLAWNYSVTSGATTTNAQALAIDNISIQGLCSATLMVNNLGDDADATPGNGVCETATGNGVCTLRAALMEANALVMCAPTTINFSVTGTINLSAALPAITSAVTIDGFQGGNTCPASGLPAPATMQIVLNGGGGAFDGLTFNVASGGPSFVRGLVIQNFGDNGLQINTASATNALTVECNYLGTNAAGNVGVGNGGNGIVISSSPNNVVQRNLIADSRNQGSGAVIVGAAATGNKLSGNYIGTDSSGASALGNRGSGVTLTDAPNNTVGGTTTAEGNLISGNFGAGVTVAGAQGNRILGNAIFANGALGIDLLGVGGVDANDADDTDAGPNNLQNFPVLTAITSAGAISGSLDSGTTNSAYPVRIEFFANTACDAAGNGEGEVYLGSMTVNAPGGFTGNVTLVPGKNFITATATDNNGNTSEFSACRVVNTPPTIGGTTVSAQQGSPAATATIVTVNDVETPRADLIVTVLSAPAGIGVTSISAPNAATGEVLATVAAACTAAPGANTVVLQVTDGGGAMATANLMVNVMANAAPQLAYDNQSVAAGGTLNINPQAANDNGSITSYSIVSVVPALNVAPTVNAAGIVALNGAGPGGPHTITVRATDNCHATTDASFTLTVNCPALSVNPTNLPNGVVGASYAQTITPSGGTSANYTYSSSGALPLGLALSPGPAATASLSGTPTVSGAYNFTLTATDANGCTGTSPGYAVTISQAPAITSANLATFLIGQANSFTVTTTGNPPVTTIAQSGTLPAGVSFTNNGNGTATLAGTPAAGAAASYLLTFTASNGISPNATQNFTLVIGCTGTITLPPLPNATAGLNYNQSVAATPSGSYSYALVQGGLPPGLTLNSQTGDIAGLPHTLGTYAFKLQAQLVSNGCSNTQNYALAVVCPTIDLSPTTLPPGAVGTAYNQSLSATPATTNYSFALSSGALPPGLMLNSATGRLSGMPTQNGSFTFTVRATGFGACTGTRLYTLEIQANCATFSLPANLPGGRLYQVYSQSVAATPAGVYSYVLTGSPPPGVIFYASIGLLFGYPTGIGTFNFQIKATASSGCTALRSYSIQILNGAALTHLSDYDGDGQSDPALWSPTNGEWRILASRAQQRQTLRWGVAGDRPLLGDYDGDGQTDLAVFRPDDGTWQIQLSRTGQTQIRPWGLATDVPVPGDYDGDGQTDLAVWRGASGAWYIWRSTDQHYEVSAWGAAQAPYFDVPVPGDYNGDGKTDLAVFRRSNGTWYVRLSDNGQYLIRHWGLGTDVPVPGDYDGDGKCDTAVWRGAASTWYIWQSRSDDVRSVLWGSSLAPYYDQAAPSDYDGDGQTDIAVWRPATQSWFIIKSRDSALQLNNLGLPGDVPVAARQP